MSVFMLISIYDIVKNAYDSEMRDYEQRTFSFVDASGAYRRWGDDFVDGAGSHVRCPRY